MDQLAVRAGIVQGPVLAATGQSTSSVNGAALGYVFVVAVFLLAIAGTALFPRGGARIRGGFLGLLTLATIFFVPFGTSDSSTLFGKVGPWIANLGAISSTYTTADQTYAYILGAAFILLVVAGVTGVFPLVSGVLGLIGMATITIAPPLVYPHGPIAIDPGPGFIILWAVSFASVAVSLRGRTKKPGTPAGSPSDNEGKAEERPGEALTTGQAVCPNCGAPNAVGAVQCSNCGIELLEES